MKTIVLTSDKTSWALKAFDHQWLNYWAGVDYDGNRSDQYFIAGYTKPDFYLPGYAHFDSIGNFADYPVNKWSDGVIQYLSGLKDDLVLILMDDYWLARNVDHYAVDLAINYMANHPDIARFDLTTDRMYDKHHELESIGRIDLVEAEKDATYNLSFQASIWRRKLLLEVLRPGETPWESELLGTERLNHTEYRIVGTRQWPINYIVAVNKGKLDLSANWMLPPRSLCDQDRVELVHGGFIPQERF